MILYKYVGPLELLDHLPQTERVLVEKVEEVRLWAQSQCHGELIATFIVDAQNRLWIANRRSEHIACALGDKVQAAGEIEFEVVGGSVEVVGMTNQSTGFCPGVESWDALEGTLNAANLPHPPTWTTAFEFRRCESCRELNVVKEDWFVCSNCDADLPKEWNIGNEQSV